MATYKITKVIFEDDNGNQYENDIIDGCGAFITKDNCTLLLPTNNADINMHVLKMILK